MAAKQKVYCQDCKYLKTDNWNYLYYCLCPFALVKEDTPIKIEVRYANPAILNKKNNCKHYVSKK